MTDTNDFTTPYLGRRLRFCLPHIMESYIQRSILFLSIIIGVTGCSEIIPIPAYNPGFTQSPINYHATQKYQVGKVIESPNIEDPTKCRLAGPMVPDSGVKYSEYLSQALQDELDRRNLLDLKSGKLIDLYIEAINVTTASHPGGWSISIKHSLEGRTNVVHITHPIYFSNAQARIACPEAAQEFPVAVRLIIEKLLNEIAL